MKKVHIHFGSDKKFNSLTCKLEECSRINDVLDHINKTKIEVEGMDAKEEKPKRFKNLIIQTDDYGGIKEWAILGFSNNILENKRVRIDEVWLNNPPTKFYEDILKTYPKLIKKYTGHNQKLSIKILEKISDSYEENIIGQHNFVRQVLPSLYSLMNSKRTRPVTLLFLGESGVGKTETAKFINSCFKGEMVRVQFSMQQTSEAYKYIFGAEHGEDSLARELIRRESNVILLDEFDKVHSSFFNAFYQMFDEGIFKDKNYTVDVKHCIIICTSNYLTERAAEEHMGSPIYSRFSKVIKFNSISIEDRIKIAQINYNKLFQNLYKEDQKLIEDNNVLNFYLEQIQKGYYKNMRMLKNDMEDALNYEILKARKIIK